MRRSLKAGRSILILFFALLIQESRSQPVWDSLGSGLSQPNGANRTWQIGGRIFSSAAQTTTSPLYEFTQGGWSPIFTSVAFGQVTDMFYDSVINKTVILGKFGDLIGPVNATICNGIALWDWATDSITPLGVGVNFPFEYAYKGLFYDSKLFVLGRYKIIAGDTINNIMRVDLLTGAYFKVCEGDSNNLIRDIVIFNGDTIVSGSFVWNGSQYPLARIASSGFDFSVSGPYRGFSHSFIKWGDKIIFGGDMTDAIGNLNVIGSYDGAAFRTLAKTNGTAKTIQEFKNELYIGGSFSLITDSSGVTIPVNNLAKWNGVAWDNVLGGCTDTSISRVTFLFPANDTLYVSGKFNHAGSITALNVARLIDPFPNTIYENLLKNQKLILYPNPNKGQFTLSSVCDNNESTDLIEIFDYTGKKVAQYWSKLPIDIDIDLQKGIYVLKVNTLVIRFLVL